MVTCCIAINISTYIVAFPWMIWDIRYIVFSFRVTTIHTKFARNIRHVVMNVTKFEHRPFSYVPMADAALLASFSIVSSSFRSSQRNIIWWKRTTQRNENCMSSLLLLSEWAARKWKLKTCDTAYSESTSTIRRPNRGHSTGKRTSRIKHVHLQHQFLVIY